jgi:hypothetical protein
LNVTAHGYRKMISMSKMMNSIAVRIELDREAAAAHRLRRRLDAALVRLELRRLAAWADQLGDADRDQRERRRQANSARMGTYAESDMVCCLPRPSGRGRSVPFTLFPTVRA